MSWREDVKFGICRVTRLFLGSANGGLGTELVYTGEGTPEANVVAPIGSIYLRTDGGASTTLYVKESGTGDTGWVAK